MSNLDQVRLDRRIWLFRVLSGFDLFSFILTVASITHLSFDYSQFFWQLIDSLIEKNQVMIFTKSSCYFCNETKSTLKTEGVDFQVSVIFPSRRCVFLFGLWISRRKFSIFLHLLTETDSILFHCFFFIWCNVWKTFPSIWDKIILEMEITLFISL